MRVENGEKRGNTLKIEDLVYDTLYEILDGENRGNVAILAYNKTVVVLNSTMDTYSRPCPMTFRKLPKGTTITLTQE